MAAAKAALARFDAILRKEVYPEVGTAVTSDSELNRAGKRLIGRAFTGVYASDTIPPFARTGSSYCVVNIDNHTQEGSHWLGLAKRGTRVYLYDSFGRAASEVLPNLAASCREQGMTLVAKKSKPEQTRSQEDCGARSLAWLLLFKRYGARIATLVSE
jgi:hypothetical protein